MKIIAVTENGGPEALQVIDRPEVHAGPGQVRVRVSHAAVSPTDTLRRAGLAGAPPASAADPMVPGMDVAGTVDEVGQGGDEGGRLHVGQAVMAVVVPDGAHGGYSSSLVLPEASVVASPAGASPAQASTLPMNGLTALLSLRQLDLPAGATLAVTGAAGAYGGYVVQLARDAGLTVVADAKDGEEDLVRALGADHVVPRGDGFADAVRAVAPGGVDALADGAVQEGAVAGAVRDGGAMAVIRGWDGDPGRGITVHPTMVFSVAEDTAALERLSDLAGRGVLTLRVADVLPMDQAAQAHRLLEAGGVRGRLVLDLSL